MAKRRQIRLGLAIALAAQVLLLLAVPPVASASTHQLAPSEAQKPSPAEYPYIATSLRPATSSPFAPTGDVPRVNAEAPDPSVRAQQPPTTLDVAIVSPPWATLDSSILATGPQVFVVEAVITNTGTSAAEGLVVTLDYDDPTSDWRLLAGEDPQRSMDLLAPGTTYHAYWFARYPLQVDATHQYTVTASATNATAVATSNNYYGNPEPGQTVKTRSTLSTGNSGVSQVSADVAVGVAFTVTITYDLGKNPLGATFSPVGNTDFAPGAYRLLSSQVRFYNDAGTQQSIVADRLYFDGLPAFADNAQATFTFIALILADSRICPYTVVAYQSNVKYDQFYCSDDLAHRTTVPITGTLSMSLTKQVSSPTIQQGQLLSYTLSYVNGGDLPMTYVWIWDDVDTALGSIVTSTISPPSDPGETTSSRVAWYLATVQPGQSGTLGFTLLVDGNGQDLADDTLLVNDGSAGINPGSLPQIAVLTSTVTTTVQAPTLVLSKTDGRETAEQGAALDYALQITNVGSVTAAGVVITDVLPTDVNYTSGTATPPETSRTGQTLVWTDLGPVAPVGGSVVITIPATVTPQTANGTVLTNAMTVRYANPAGHLFATQSAVDTTIVNAPVLAIGKSDFPDPVLTGRPITYTLHYTNSGPAPATNVLITDTVPLSTTYLGCQGGSICSMSDGVVSWDVGTLSANTQAAVGFSVLVSDALQTGAVIRNEQYGLVADQTGFVAGPPETTQVRRDAAVIEGYAFVDADGDGERDAGEAGLSGVTVTLPQATAPVTSTGSTGYYRFRVEIQGPISVTANLPANHFRTTPGTVYLESTFQITQTVDFGYALLASEFGVIYGTVFDDANYDVAQGAGEQGLVGVTLTSSQATTSPVTTNEWGQYTFRYNASGPVSITETDPPGYVSTTANVVQTSAAIGSTGPSPVDFGDFYGARVTGRVFDDVNVNGLNDDGAFVPGAIVAADYAFTTDSTGVYTLYITVLDSTPITISETDPAAYISTDAVPGSGMSRVDASTLRIGSPAAGTTYSAGDFGDVLASDVVTISGQVWDDNGAGGGGLANGLRDGTETGLAGATVGLSSGLSQVTAADGLFLLYAPPNQTVVVTEANPAGFASTNAIPGAAASRVDQDTLTVGPLSGGSTSAGNLFGDVQASSVALLTGAVFDDANENGLFDGGELGLSGVTVTLETGAGLTIDVRTDASGNYQFAVRPGTDVRIASAGPAGGFYPTTPETVVLRPPAAGTFLAHNFGYSNDTDAAVVSGLVFDDLDSDGQQDLGEPGLAGAAVTLGGYPPVVTGGNGLITGTFTFRVAPAGFYTLHETNPAGYRSATPDDVIIQIALGNGYYVEFGDTSNPQTASIYGIAFDDLNGDGVQNAGEPGLPGVTISVTVGANVLTATTQSYGQYNYGLETGTAGWHTVTEQDPAQTGYRSTTPDEINIDVELGNSYVVNFGDTANNSFSTIMGTVFRDDSGNGVQDPSEPGIAGVLISLSNGLTATTNGYGNYTFPISAVGPLRVIETDPAGFHSTTPNTVTIQVSNLGQVYVANFGDSQNIFVSSVFGTVFHDRNANGNQDLADTPLSGVTVRLDGLPGITNQWGQYTFLIEYTGTYTITETDPPGFFSTTPNTVTLNAELGTNYQVDYGDAATSSSFAAIYGTVFNDADSDRQRDAGEMGIPGVTVTLDRTRATITDLYGRYTLSTTVAGTHTVVETDPPASSSTTPNTVTLNVQLGHGYEVNFGDFLEACTCPGDQYEGDDAVSTAKFLAMGPSNRQAHTFCDDAGDWVRFDAQAGHVYTITTSSWGQRADTFLSLFDTDGRTLLVTNDDYAGTTNYSSRVTWRVRATGTYYVHTANRAGLTGCHTEYEIWIEHLAGSIMYLPIVMRTYPTPSSATTQTMLQGNQQVPGIGSSSMADPAGSGSLLYPTGIITHTCRDVYEIDDTWQQARRIQPGLVQVHSFDSNPASYAADKDIVWFEIRPQRTVTFTITAVTNTLTLLELYNSQGVGLGVTGTTRLKWTATTAGRYYLSVSPLANTFGCANTAGYNLRAEISREIYLPIVSRNSTR